MKLYKLTDENGCTQNNTQWGEGVTHTATGSPDIALCTDGWIHAYEHPLIAVFMNPAQAGFKNPRLWQAEGDIVKQEGQLKCGCRALTTVKEILLPVITIEQRVEIAIRCVKLVRHDPAWNLWADNWLSGKDRSARSAEAWTRVSTRVSWAEAARSAWAMAFAEAWAAQAGAAHAQAWAAHAESWAAHAVAWAAHAARAARAEIDLVAIISTVVNPNNKEGK